MTFKKKVLVLRPLVLVWRKTVLVLKKFRGIGLSICFDPQVLVLWYWYCNPCLYIFKSSVFPLKDAMLDGGCLDRINLREYAICQ